MSWIWSLPAILCVTLAGVFYPVFTRRGREPMPVGLEGDPREELAAWRDGVLMQLKELELESSRAGESSALRASLEQELAEILTRQDALTATGSIPNGTAPVDPKKSPLDMAMGVAVILFAGVITSGLYLFLGTPREIAPGSASNPAIPHEIATMVEQAAQRLQSNPDDIEGWMRLARSYVVLNRVNDALAAYEQILSRHPEEIDAVIALAELELQSPDSRLQRSGAQRLEALLTRQPDHPDALWYLGAVALRAGDREKARTLWKRLLPLLPPGSKAIKTVEQGLAQIGPP
ncbi:MAG: tetratricopeptide repeat protein [Magnetococcales bacterium]|nr:tetratricopeptide repeat protein [Magnetococcales bacterium]